MRAKKTTRRIDVHIKMIADQVVSFVSTFAAARGPNAVCEPWPPKAPAKSADLPCCSRTTPMRKKQTMTCTTITSQKTICSLKLLSFGIRRIWRVLRGPDARILGAEEGT